MSDLDIDSEISKLEQSLLQNTVSPIKDSISTTDSLINNSGSNKLFTPKVIKTIAASLILSLLTIIGFKPVYLCKLEYDEKEGKCKASLLFLKTSIAFICLSIFYFICITFIPKFL